MRRARWNVAIVVLVVAVLVGAGWWFLRDDDAGPGSGRSAQGAEDASPEDTPGRMNPVDSAPYREPETQGPSADPNAAAIERVLRVLVLGADGQPAPGVTVLISKRWVTVDTVLFNEKSDDDGIARFRTLDASIDWSDQGSVIEARLDILARVPPPKVVTTADLGGDSIRLQMPETGALDVEIREASGRLFGGMCRLYTGLRYQDGDEVRLWRANRFPMPVTKSGRILIEHVALDTKVWFGLDPDDPWPGGEAVVDGPVVAGEVRLVRLELKEPWPSVELRLLAEDGSLMRDQRITAELTVSRPKAGSDPALWEGRTDAEGVLVIPFHEEWEQGWTRTIDLHRDINGDRVHARLDLARELAKPRAKLGDVVLRRCPVAVAGLVLDDQGRPLARTTVMLARQHRWGDEPDEVYWRAVDSPVETDAKGCFEIRLRGEGPYQVEAWHDDHVLTECPIVVAGTRDVRLTMWHAGFVTGSVLVSRDVSDQALYLRWRPAGATEFDVQDMSGRARKGEERTFRIGRLKPGAHQVEIRTRLDAALLWSTTIDVPPGENAPKVLQRIDLRPKVRTLRITALDVDDRPVWGARVNSGKSIFGVSDRQGVVVLAHVAPIPELRIVHGEYRDVVLTEVEGEHRVRLLRRPELEFRLAGTTVPPSVVWWPRLVRNGVSAVVRKKKGIVRGRVPGPGRWTVTVSITRGALAKRIVKVEPSILDVLDTDSVQIVDLVVDPESWKVGLEKLGVKTDAK